MSRFFLALLLLACLPLSAKTGIQHAGDMGGLFSGIATEHGMKEAVYAPVDRFIDTAFPDLVRKQFGVSLPGNHRNIAHWGFSGDIPFDHEPLKSWMSANNISRKEFATLWQREVNGLVDTVMKNTGITVRQDAQALTASCYDMHLLGDLTTKEARLIQRPDAIIKDLEKNLTRLCGKNLGVEKTVGKLLSQYKQAAKEGFAMVGGERLTSQQIAQRMIDTFKSVDAAKAVWRKYGQELSAKGIRSSKALEGLVQEDMARLMKTPSALRLEKAPANPAEMAKNLAVKAGKAGKAGKALKKGVKRTQVAYGILNTSTGRLSLALRTGVMDGLLVFAMDSGIATFHHLKGDTWKAEYIRELQYAAIKGVVVGTCVAVAVVLGAAPGGWIVLAVGIGSYIVTDLAIRIWEAHEAKQYLTMEDLRGFGFSPGDSLLAPGDSLLTAPAPSILREISKESVLSR